jgi:uncharacterized membrane protein
MAATRLLIRVELISTWNDYEARRKTITETLRPMRKYAEEISRIAQSAYREGAALLHLPDVERARIESEVLYYRSLAGYQQSVTTREITLGLFP